ncbi:hypothetical protein, partial [Paraburkholderia eburnea]|uniref:hypothetical protein n=1 Tax=Paraburkholderia eburnea TaxID=1189126 RepID=UPI001ABF7887
MWLAVIGRKFGVIQGGASLLMFTRRILERRQGRHLYLAQFKCRSHFKMSRSQLNRNVVFCGLKGLSLTGYSS